MPDRVMDLMCGSPSAIDIGLALDLLGMEIPVSAYRDQQTAAGPVERFTVRGGVAVVPLRGVLTPNSEVLERWLGWSTYFGITETVTELAGRADVSAIILDVDSPGGMVVGCAAAAQAVAAAAAIKPVHTIALPLMASAAYWIGSQGTDIAVAPGGLVGSIGVAMVASSVVGPNNHGEQLYSLTSTHARAKWPDPATEEGMTELRRSLDEAEAQFHGAVSAGRGIPLDDLPARLSVTEDPRDGGAVFGGAAAIERGLADTIEGRAAFYDRVFRTYGGNGRTSSSARFSAQAAAAVATCL